MGTNATIGRYNPKTKELTCTMCHYDGYLNYMVPMLSTHYKGFDDAVKLTDAGYVSGITPVNKLVKHETELPVTIKVEECGKLENLSDYIYIYNMKDCEWYYMIDSILVFEPKAKLSYLNARFKIQSLTDVLYACKLNLHIVDDDTFAIKNNLLTKPRDEERFVYEFKKGVTPSEILKNVKTYTDKYLYDKKQVVDYINENSSSFINGFKDVKVKESDDDKLIAEIIDGNVPVSPMIYSVLNPDKYLQDERFFQKKA